MVELEAPDKEDEALLKKLIQAHFDKTGSAIAKFILADFENQLKQFVKVFPSDYKKALAKQKSKLVATK
jgi:glutamate synthase (NADPH/NADH) large chain